MSGKNRNHVIQNLIQICLEDPKLIYSRQPSSRQKWPLESTSKGIKKIPLFDPFSPKLDCPLFGVPTVIPKTIINCIWSKPLMQSCKKVSKVVVVKYKGQKRPQKWALCGAISQNGKVKLGSKTPPANKVKTHHIQEQREKSLMRNTDIF